MEELFGIAAFRSRQQVMNFEDVLRRAGIRVSIISTPRDVAIGCGLSVRFPIESLQAVQGIVQRARPGNLIGVYTVDRTGGGRPRLTAVVR